MTDDTELFIKAEAERGAGNAAAAERLYRRLLARLPNHVNALRALGDLLEQQGRVGQAASLLAAADCVDAENLARGAEGLHKLGHRQKARHGVKCALDIVERLPNRAKALRALGRRLQQQGKGDQARSLSAVADQIDADSFARGAGILIGLGHLRKAERSIKRILEVDPNHGAALWVLGQIHRSKGDFPSALDAYGRVPVSDPRCRAANYVRAILAGHTLWQAPPDSQPRPAPFMVIENFLPQESHDALLEFTFARQGEFQPSLIRSTDYDPDWRSSLVIKKCGDVKEWFLPRLKSVLPKVLSRLHMDDVDKSHIELQVTAHCDGDFYKPHTDTGEEGEESFTRRLSFVYYYYRTPKRFTGGHLLLYDTFLSGRSFVKGGFSRIEPRDNGIVFFPSQYSHEIEQVRCESKDYRDGRFTLNGWIHAHQAGRRTRRGARAGHPRTAR